MPGAEPLGAEGWKPHLKSSRRAGVFHSRKNIWEQVRGCGAQHRRLQAAAVTRLKVSRLKMSVGPVYTSMYPENSNAKRHEHPLLIAAVLTVIKTRKQPKCSSAEDRVTKACYI